MNSTEYLQACTRHRLTTSCHTTEQEETMCGIIAALPAAERLALATSIVAMWSGSVDRRPDHPDVAGARDLLRLACEAYVAALREVGS